MPILFDYDPETGIKEFFDYDPVNDQVAITYTQDVTNLLDYIKTIRDNPEQFANTTKEEWWHYCKIPEVVEIELMKKGLSLHNKDHMKAILKEINTNYPHLRLTDKWHR